MGAAITPWRYRYDAGPQPVAASQPQLRSATVGEWWVVDAADGADGIVAAVRLLDHDPTIWHPVVLWERSLQ